MQRALQLMGLGRHEEAAKGFREALANDPGDGYALAHLSLCLHLLGKPREALETAQQAVAASPNSAFAHQTLGMNLLERGQRKVALQAFRAALELDLEDPGVHGWISRWHLDGGDGEQGLQWAEKGLALDPDDDLCRFQRVRALNELGRIAEAGRDADELLALDPHDDAHHRLKGLIELEEGRPENARQHFLEALRLDPNNEEARTGLAMSLKARHRLYGWLLGRILKLGRLGKGHQWIVIGIGVGCIFALDRAAKSLPAHAPWFLLLKVVLLFYFGLITLAQPFFNIVLLLDREGRRALSPAHATAARAGIACLAFAGLFMWWWLESGKSLPGRMAVASAFLLLVADQTAWSPSDWVRRRMRWVGLAAVVLAIAPVLWVMAVTLAALGGSRPLALTFAEAARWVFMAPAFSILVSVMSDNIREYFERNQPDPS